ncbi:TetR/AcrR family transcriptional regulator [bacterium]|nr:TetR/AcrR family transcriptional regulator [bacterium]
MKTPPEDLARKLLAVSDQLTGTNLDVSIDDIAQMAGVPRATLYYYFSGKEDLVSFFLSDKLGRASVAIQKAVNREGSVVERLEDTLRSVMQAMAEHPAICTEMPGAIKEVAKYGTVVNEAERVMVAPFRELLIEGNASGALAISDVNTAAIALLGAVNMVAMFQLVQTGTIDVEATNASLIPLLVEGVLPR